MCYSFVKETYKKAIFLSALLKIYLNLRAFNMASNLLSIVRQESKPIDEEKLRIICTKRNIWDHFRMSREHFSSTAEHEQMRMLHRFYNDPEPVYFAQNKTSVDSSISENIKNSTKMTMAKVIEDRRGRSEIEVTVDKDQEKKRSKTL